ncbi:uncharacterized protein LOC143450324 isoform X2 [Clavelina lepadiformis]|uniref:uncharacterized protein LOC143450324 isoform X2 n=1 Tax=Clavelina lepadiformis TaxID=159417 RepID=UPI0040424D93
MLPKLSIDSDSDDKRPSLTSSRDEFHTELPISARAMVVLSRAARKNVQQQQQMLRQQSPKYPRYLKSSIEQRRKVTKVPESTRVETLSAPPNFGYPVHVMNPVLHSEPPKIVIINASQDGSRFEGDKLPKNETTDREQQFKQYSRRQLLASSKAKAPQSKPPFHFEQVEFASPRISPDFHLKPNETPRSNVTSTDWEWVRERLASRESAFTRPESSLTFADFLDALEPGSDEYDTDLEDNFVDCNYESRDFTGLSNYKQACRRKGIPVAQQIVQKLSDKKASFRLNHRKNYTITKLDLSDNALQNDVGGHLSAMLTENNSLTHINISNNKLGDKEALMLCESLRFNTSLLSLDISHNQLTDIGGQAFAAALMDNSVMNSLDLSWNMLGKKAGSAIGKALKLNKSLKSLDLSWNGLGDEGAGLLARPLRNNTALKHLSLAVNHIGPFGIECLANGICGSRLKRGKRSNCVLQTLILDRNPLGSKGLSVFIKHMEQSEVLIDLSIKEVVLASDFMSKIRKLTTSRSVSIHYEGQLEEDKHICAIRFGSIALRQVLSDNRIQLRRFFKSLDADKTGASPAQVEVGLSSMKRPTSEIELRRLIQSLNSRGTNLIHFKDVAQYSYTPPPAPAKPKKVRTKKRSSIY